MYTFAIDKPSNLPATIKHLKQLAAANNINCQGDEKSGHGESHGVKASYEVGDREIKITIEKKPFALPNPLIEKLTKDFIRTNQMS